MEKISGNIKIPWHALSVDEVLLKLKSHSQVGLKSADLKNLVALFGKNTLAEPKRRSHISIFLHQFLSPLIYLLITAAIIALFIGESRDAIIIFVVIFLNAFIGALQEGRAEQSLLSLRRLSSLKSRVLRDGKESLIEASELLPGDILILNAGDAVPADARLIEASSISAAEAALTGESLPISKSIEVIKIETPLADRQNMIYASTFITAGRGLAIVVATGESREIGKIAKLATSTIQPKTQLEKRIQQFGKYLVAVAIIVFILVVGMGLIREIPFAQIFMIAIGQMVSLVPEGLPVAITIALAVGVQKMAKQRTIVRRLSAVENLGSTTVICSDKTGTLTRNEMTVTSVYLPYGNRELTITGVGYGPEGQFIESKEILSTPQTDLNLEKLFMTCSLCNDAQIIAPNEKDSRFQILGDPTEGALLTFALKGGLSPDLTRKQFPRIAELPFSSESKLMATQHQLNGKNITFIKGAPEVLLDFCKSIYHANEDIPFSDIYKNEAEMAAKKMASKALRVLAFGYIEDSSIDESKGFSPFKGLVTFLGFVGELDPPRSEVAASIRDCHLAGIRPVMVTGDHKTTGLAIAKSLGISRNDDLAIDGVELEQLSDEELLKKIDRITVFARVHPAQKLRIVEAYQKKGEIVAMTGDGVNDAPALVRADVGIAMGITGTDVAKDAAKIVITDDNFSTIIAAISEGRLVYQNIKKLILFLFVTSIDEVLILFLALIFGYPPPLAAVQILWLNLVSEGTLTINLIMEPSEGDEMKRQPIPKNLPLLDHSILSRMPLMVIASVTSTFGWFIYRSSQGVPTELVQSETFTVLVVCQWFNILNCRSNTQSALTWNLLKNPWLLGGLALSNVLHAFIIYYPPMNKYFHTTPIQAEQFWAIGIVASLVLWVEELRKFRVRYKCNS